MALTVEDGTVVPDADSYLSSDDAQVYWDAHGMDHSSFGEEQLDVALRKATQYLDLVNDWKGCALDPQNQPLEWPRYGVVDQRSVYLAEDEVPQPVKDACAEYAFRALSGELMPDPEQEDTGQTVVAKREKIGPIDVSVEYTGGAGPTIRPYPVADRLIRHLVKPRGGRVYRA